MLAWLVILLVGVPLVMIAMGRQPWARRLGAGDLGASPEPVAGHPMSAGWVLVRTEPRGRADADVWRYECRIYGLLPPWVAVIVTGGEPEDDDGLARALFGPTMAQLPRRWTVTAVGPDLVVQGFEIVCTSGAEPNDTTFPGRGVPDHDVAVEAFTRALGEAAASMETDALVRALAEQVNLRGSAHALSLLGRHFGGTDIAHTTIARAAREGPPEVRIAAARLGAPLADEVLLEVARDESVSSLLRVRAVLGLSARRSKAALRTLAIESDGALDPALLGALRGDDSPESMALALRALTSDREDLVGAAADALARVGGREAIAPLRARLERGGSRSLRDDLELTIELVQARLHTEAGHLSLLDEGPGVEIGHLSVADAPRGGLSAPED